MLLANPNAVKSAFTLSFKSALYKCQWIQINIFLVCAPILMGCTGQGGPGQGTLQSRCTHLCFWMSNYLKLKQSHYSMGELRGKGGEWRSGGTDSMAGSIPGMCLAPAPVLVGEARCWAAPPGNLARRIYLWGEERSWFGQLFLEVLGKHLETLHHCPSPEPFTNVWGVVAIPGVWKMWDLLQKNTVLSQRKHSNLVWCDTLCL